MPRLRVQEVLQRRLVDFATHMIVRKKQVFAKISLIKASEYMALTKQTTSEG